MKIRQAAVLAAACLAASAFAQGSVTSSTGASVSSGTGIVVTPSLPEASVTVLPSTVAAIPDGPLLPGGTMVQYSTTTVMGAPAGTTTKVTRYWVNVPADVASRDSFQRWQRLK
jgi:hypothetical protein